MKKIVFTKTQTKQDVVEYFFNRSIARIENPKQRILAHDLIHAIVERHLEVRGFKEMVFAGGDAGASLQLACANDSGLLKKMDRASCG